MATDVLAATESSVPSGTDLRSAALKTPPRTGLLTDGSSYRPRLPDLFEQISGIFAAFVPDYSGGTVPDFNGIPFSGAG